MLFAVFAIYVALGILYESFVHTSTILSGVPAAAVGALAALMLCRTALDLFAMVGIVMLIGIVKQKAIMMIDCALQLRHRRGFDAEQTIFEACTLRFRPIMMTTMYTLGGTLPIAFG